MLFRAKEKNAQSILNALDKAQAVIEFTPQGQVLSANANFCRTMGYAPEEIIGKHHSMFVDPAYAATREYALFWENLRAGKFDTQQFMRIGKGGTRVWLQASYIPVQGPNGEVVKVVKFASAVPERVAAITALGAALSELAKGKLDRRLTMAFPADLEQTRADFNQACEALQSAITRVSESANVIARAAVEIGTASDDLSHRTERQAASLEETAAALEQITATVKRTAGNARAAATGATAAKSAADKGGSIVETAIKAMDGISQSSRQMTEIIGVIDEIAFQTNLLALNAGVEAARAGDAGRGFAVVASEVRALAQRSSEAAKQIKSLIKASGEQVSSGVHYVGETGEALKLIAAEVLKIDSLIAEMAQAAEQQATGIEEVNAAVGQMDQVTQQNAAMVEQATAASRNLVGETDALSELVHMFSFGAGSGEAQKVQRSAAPQRAVTRNPIKLAATGGAGSRRAAVSGDSWTEF